MLERWGRDVWIVGLAILAAIAVGLFLGRPEVRSETVSVVLPTEEPSAVPARSIVVHVSGAVAAPGLVRVGMGARVADVIAAAGGVQAGADLAGINLAESVVDGQQVVVPAERDGGGGSAVAVASGLIRINQADLEQLQSLPGVGPVLAGNIVAYREAHGPFGAVEDLLGVPGIGEGKLASLRDLVAVP